MHGNSASNWRKTSKGFYSQTTHRIGLKSSLCNSPGEALQEGVSSVAIRPPIPDISGWTDTQTDRHTEYEYYYIRFENFTSVNQGVLDSSRLPKSHVSTGDKDISMAHLLFGMY